MKHFAAIGFLCLLVFSCKKEPDQITSPGFVNQKIEEPDTIYEGPVILGDQLPNPYTVPAMKEAYDDLISQGVLNGSELDIMVTHKYVRFFPQSEEEFDFLTSDSTLMLYDHPLDYEILKDGDYYHDPSLPEEGYTYLYGVVPDDYNLSVLPATVLAEIFLDVEDGENDIYYLVEEQSFRNHDLPIDFEDEPEGNGKKTAMARKYNPSGSVRFNDDDLGTVEGMRGVKIYVRRWFKTAYTLTDGNGNFRISKRYKGKVRYKVKWERSRFTIRQGTWLQAYTKGPKTKSAWQLNILPRGTRRWHYGCIHTAAHQMYYGNRHGLQRPPGSSGNKLKIGAYDGSGTGDHAYWRTFFSWPRIRIYDFNRNAAGLYSTTVHELAHAIHWSLPGNFNQVEDLLVESFAAGMDWFFVRDRYGDAIAEIESMQNRRLSNCRVSDCGYSPMIVDLMDRTNQRGDQAFTGCIAGTFRNSPRGSACRIGVAPAGTSPFVWSNSFYHTPLPGGGCPPGTTFDGQNCLVGAIPAGKIHFIEGQEMFIDCEGDTDFPSDYVRDYAPYQIQNALHHVTIPVQLRNNLRAQYWNPCEGIELDNLFNNYIGISTDNGRCKDCLKT